MRFTSTCPAALWRAGRHRRPGRSSTAASAALREVLYTRIGDDIRISGLAEYPPR